MVSISAPFNVQHNPKVKDVAVLMWNNKSNKNEQESRSLRNTYSQNSSTQSVSTAHNSGSGFRKNAIVVCTIEFTAEYHNELSCSPGEVFKLIDPKVVNGWVLVQSVSNGAKGWAPNSSMKLLDLFKNKNENTSKPSLGSQPSSVETSPCVTSPKKDTRLLSLRSSAASSSTSSSNSFIDYYASPRDSLPYSSVYVHSMYLREGNRYMFWYRVDLQSKNIPNQIIHLARYYNEFASLHKALNKHIKSLNLDVILPKLPPSVDLLDSSEELDSLSRNLSNLNRYLNVVFAIVNQQPTNSPLLQTLVTFLSPIDKDFQHYVSLTDDEIMKILTPQSCNNPEEIPLDISLPNTTDNNGELFAKPSSIGVHRSASVSSTSSHSSKISNILDINKSNDFIKIKIIYRDEFSIIKLDMKTINFLTLSKAVARKVNRLNGLTLAYKNSNSVFILLRDDEGLERALKDNNSKLIIKVI